MSILKKNTLALAIIAAAGFATSASAYVIGTRATGAAANSAVDQTAVRVATSEIAGAATIVESGEDIAIQVNADSLILGRTTGMTLRLDLTNGARFSQNLNLTSPADGANDEVRIGSALPAGWTASISAGGTAGSSFVIFNFNPPNVVAPAVVPGLLQGDIIVIEGGVFAVPVAATNTVGVSLSNLTALQSANATVGITSQFRDPNTAAPIMAAQTTPILTSGNPIVQSCDQTDRFQVSERIDVGSIAQPAGAGQGPRVGFSTDGSIGTVVNNATRNYIFNAGRVRHQIDPVFTTFAYAGTDVFTFALTLADGGFATGGAFNPANSLFLSANNTCTLPVASTVVSTVGNTRTISYTGTAANTQLGLLPLPTTIAAGYDLFVCLQVPTTNTTVIAPTGITGTSTHARGTAVTPAHAACTLAPLQTNGSVVNIANLPPAGNPTQEGLIRIVNNSTTTGTVTIRAKDDTGQSPNATPVTFTLAAGRSVVYTTAELETGTAATVTPAKPALSGSFGDGAGRWRVNIVGEFDNMQVQAYVRNVNNDALSNITDFESNQEQSGERKNLNFD